MSEQHLTRHFQYDGQWGIPGMHTRQDQGKEKKKTTNKIRNNVKCSLELLISKKLKIPH